MKVAGEFAVEFELLPFDMEEIDESVLSVWKVWLDDASNLSDADRGVKNVREFLQKHVASRFDSGRSHESLIRDCAGYPLDPVEQTTVKLSADADRKWCVSTEAGAIFTRIDYGPFPLLRFVYRGHSLLCKGLILPNRPG
jgi:hypothetical protein